MHTKKRIFVADLTHTAQGIAALSFPLGASFIVSYAKKMLGDSFDFRLFKFPEKLALAIRDEPPDILGLSGYSWNLEIGHRLASWAKQRNPNLVVIMGGPNFPTAVEDKAAFLAERPAIDFFIENEGEVGFVALLGQLLDHGLDAAALKRRRPAIVNCAYLAAPGDFVDPTIRRIDDVNQIPSPYLSGILDEFFESPLVPMLETTRGCPFSCAFCADGLASKNLVTRFEDGRTREELDYIARRVRNVDEIIITDLNFGMYKQDADTARAIADLQDRYKWPVLVKASAGKNKPERVIEAASILKGAWVIGSAVQSTDPEVLRNIKRANISTKAYEDFIRYVNSQSKEAQSYTEIILALPGDTKAKHFGSLRTGIEARVNTVRMYQAMLLVGTDMASSDTRRKFDLLGRYRIMPGCLGTYKFGDDTAAVAEIEEIIVASKDMSFDDYVSCRVMNLIIETFYNNSLFEEVFQALRAMNLSVFDVLAYLHARADLYTPRMRAIVDSFVAATRDDLYPSRAAARDYIAQPEVLEKHLSGELGTNELLGHRAMLYLELEDISAVLVESVKRFLAGRGMLDDRLVLYLDEVRRYILCKKRDVHCSESRIEESFRYDFGAIEEADFGVDPRELDPSPTRVPLVFFHTDGQRQHIRNALALYLNHPGGLGRMIQRNNLKMMYRQVARAVSRAA